MAITNKVEFNYNLISKYRNLLFGVSAIMVILFHYAADIKTFGGSRIAQQYQKITIDLMGSCGVDIFAFLSGVGSYYSLKSCYNFRHFFIKRVIKLFISYLVVAIPFWVILDFVINQTGISGFISDLFFISFFSNGTRDYWYICFALISYLIIPSIYRYIEKCENGPKLYYSRCCILLSAYFLVLFLSGIVFPEFIINTEIMLGRFLTVFLGLMMGRLIYAGSKMKKSHILIMISMLFLTDFCKNAIKISWIRMLFNRWNLGIKGVLFILAFCLMRSLLSDEKNTIDEILNYVGSYSLELYLIHVSIRGLLYNSPIYSSNLLLYATMIVVSFLLSIALKSITKRISAKLLISRKVSAIQTR